MNAKKQKCTKYVLIGEELLFILSDRVEDLDGNLWEREVFRNSLYLRKKGTSKRISRKTVVNNIKPCNILW